MSWIYIFFIIHEENIKYPGYAVSDVPACYVIIIQACDNCLDVHTCLDRLELGIHRLELP